MVACASATLHDTDARVIPVVTFLTPLAEYFSDLNDRKAMFSQVVLALKRKIKQVFLLVVHMRFLFSLSQGNPAAAAAAAAAAATPAATAAAAAVESLTVGLLTKDL